MTHMTIKKTMLESISRFKSSKGDMLRAQGMTMAVWAACLCPLLFLLTAARDKKQPTVMDLLPPEYAAIGCMPVGRLDKDTTGLLLLTTDGELNHRLLAPARHVDKTYLATLDKPVGDKEVAVFASGLSLSDFEAAPADLTPLPGNQARVTIHEGKFHQVKRMFAAVEREVLTLHRETFGSLALDEALPCGQWRELTEAEASALYRDAQMEEKHG